MAKIVYVGEWVGGWLGWKPVHSACRRPRSRPRRPPAGLPASGEKLRHERGKAAPPPAYYPKDGSTADSENGGVGPWLRSTSPCRNHIESGLCLCQPYLS
jgi:hypothetical protein